MTQSPLREYQTNTYDLTVKRLQKEASERKNWLDGKLAKKDIQLTKP